MKEAIESLIQQGNTCFLAGKPNDAIHYYYNALEQSGALKTVIKYAQKNKDNLSEDEHLLKELLQTKYDIHLIPGALYCFLIATKKQIEEIEEKEAYQKFKKLILSKHPKTPEQYVDILLRHYEDPPWQEMIFLSQILLENGHTYYVCDVDRLVHERTKALELKRFEHSLHKKKSTKLSDIDTMTGYEFEDFLVDLFRKLGYSVERRKRSHEQGLDFLLERHGERIACQVKRHSKPVGNRAVQEANAARDYYRCHRALVVTNSGFTTPAKQLAERCNVELWDRKTLKEKIKTIM